MSAGDGDEIKNPPKEVTPETPVQKVNEAAGDRMAAGTYNDGSGQGSGQGRRAGEEFNVYLKQVKGAGAQGDFPAQQGPGAGFELVPRDVQVGNALNRPVSLDEQRGVVDRVNGVLNARPDIARDMKNLFSQLPTPVPPGAGNDADPHVRNGRAVHAYISANSDSERAQALETLKVEALSGNNPSAIKALRDSLYSRCRDTPC